MSSKSIIIFLVFLALLVNISLAQKTPTDFNKSIVLNQYYYSNPLQDSQKVQSYSNEKDTFLNTVSMYLGIYGIIIALFGIIIAIAVGFGIFINFRQLKELKDSVQKDIERGLEEKAQKLIKEVMKTEYDNQLNDMKIKITTLENYVNDLKRAIETEQPIPDYKEENKDNKILDKNVFDEQ